MRSRARQFVALDVETTGLFAETDRIVEIGAVRFDASGRELDRFERLVNPCRPIPSRARAIHGISEADLVGAATAEVVLLEFLAFLGDSTTTLLAHNAIFDAGMVGTELARANLTIPGHTIVDTLALARRRLPTAPDHRLETLAALLNLDPDGPHRALADSRRVMKLWLALGPPEPDQGRGLVAGGPLIAYAFFDGRGREPAPTGWERLAEAIARGLRVRVQYDGGSRGTAPREITPRRFVRRNGVSYVVAFCHLDAFEKSFRLDRIRRYDVVR